MTDQYADALEAYMTSEYGKKCLDIHSLENAKGQAEFAKYLRARLEHAHLSGWNSGVAACSGIIER